MSTFTYIDGVKFKIDYLLEIIRFDNSILLQECNSTGDFIPSDNFKIELNNHRIKGFGKVREVHTQWLPIWDK